MFIYPAFDAEIVRRVDARRLVGPARGETGDGSGLGCNRTYVDMQRFSWADAKRVTVLEQEFMARIVSIADTDPASEALEDEILEGERYLYGLDLGVASTVVALSAARCIPFSSCNAATFGGHHQEKYPLVAFYARAQMIDLLIASAEEAEIGLQDNGYLVAYADDLRKLGQFSRSLISRRVLFAAVRVRNPSRTKLDGKSEQCRLPLE
jgi:hypothetical protein